MSTTSGATVVTSVRGFDETLQTLIDGLSRRGVEIFGRIDNTDAASPAVNLNAVVVFGVAKAGTPMMQTNRSLGVDLPLRALVYQDGGGQVFISYNQPGWMVKRKDLQPDALASLAGMTKLLETVVAEAAGGAPVT